MSDLKLRDLERRFKETGSPQDDDALNLELLDANTRASPSTSLLACARPTN